MSSDIHPSCPASPSQGSPRNNAGNRTKPNHAVSMQRTINSHRPGSEESRKTRVGNNGSTIATDVLPLSTRARFVAFTIQSPPGAGDPWATGRMTDAATMSKKSMSLDEARGPLFTSSRSALNGLRTGVAQKPAPSESPMPRAYRSGTSVQSLSLRVGRKPAHGEKASNQSRTSAQASWGRRRDLPPLWGCHFRLQARSGFGLPIPPGIPLVIIR